MRRRAFIALSGALPLGAPVVAGAQPERVPRIGVLTSAIEPRNLGLERRLKTLGYEVGRNLDIDFRFAENRLERLPGMARELVATRPDLIYAPTNPEIIALAQATTTIPIVMGYASLPVELGLVRSLARPGGNLTGTTTSTAETAGKMLEVLRDALPRARRVAFAVEPGYPGMDLYARAFDQAGQSMNLQIVRVGASTLDELDAMLARLERERPDAVSFSMTGVFLVHEARLIEFAARQRLPAIYSINRPVRYGGLMSYAPDFGELIRRQVAIIDRILKGARPADIPVEEPSKFRLIVNRKTAAALGLAFPPGFAMRVDEYYD